MTAEPLTLEAAGAFEKAASISNEVMTHTYGKNRDIYKTTSISYTRKKNVIFIKMELYHRHHHSRTTHPRGCTRIRKCCVIFKRGDDLQL